MRAHARLEVALAPGTGRTAITRLRSEPPLSLRPTHEVGPDPLRHLGLAGHPSAHVTLASAAAGPVGGDELRLDVTVGPGATLVLRTVSASLALPGPRGELSRTEMTAEVADEGTFVWLPQPLIAARRCRHEASTTIDLGRGARLLTREELVLGRHGETAGAIRQRLRVTLAGRPLHDQELHLEPENGAWASAAVAGGRRVLGSALLVDPSRDHGGRVAFVGEAGADVAILPLSGPAVLVTALGQDALTVRRHLDRCLAPPHRRSCVREAELSGAIAGPS